MNEVFHPLANCFPLMEGQEFEEFVADIAAHGMRSDIVMFEGKVLDGRNRYRACQRLGIEPRSSHYEGSDPVAFVVSTNLHRRHLNESQRGLIAARLAAYVDGSNQFVTKTENEGTPIGEPSSREVAAKALNVGTSTVDRAKVILREGTAEEIKAVEDGVASVTGTAEKIKERNTGQPRRKKKSTQSEKQELANEKKRQRAAVWNDFRGALDHIFNLPAAEDVIEAIRTSDRSGLTQRRLSGAVARLSEIENAWSKQGDAGRGHAGDGREAA